MGYHGRNEKEAKTRINAPQKTMTHPSGWNLQNTYGTLDARFFTRVKPTPVQSPELLLLNEALAGRLGLDPEALRGDAGARIFSGNDLPPGADPLAQAYAGHQFGHFNVLGDGRALLLGEQVTPSGERFDIHLKGSGQTPYSRRGDGRAALAPMLREYLISEAMAALGIPTTRSLAVVATGEPVFRETVLPGAVLARVAKSHIRVGTFEYAARVLGPQAVRELADFAISRHYPAVKESTEPYRNFLLQVIEAQARLVAQWMNVGFIHGVMNTDNMTLSGETIDYGPCAFMDRFDLGTVFSSIDHQGRYAFGNQPSMAHWNLTRLAETLLPLLSADQNDAIRIAKECLETFSTKFNSSWTQGMLKKLGLPESVEAGEEATSLIEALLSLMKKYRLDFTLTFRALTRGELPIPGDASLTSEFATEYSSWQESWVALKGSTPENLREAELRMKAANPHLIPRNHHVENALKLFSERNQPEAFLQLLHALSRPFEDLPEHAAYLEPAPDSAEPYQTFCGT